MYYIQYTIRYEVKYTHILYLRHLTTELTQDYFPPHLKATELIGNIFVNLA